MGHKLLPGVEDGDDVVGVLVLEAVVGLGLQKGLHLLKVLALLQQGDGVVLASGIRVISEENLFRFTVLQVYFIAQEKECCVIFSIKKIGSILFSSSSNIFHCTRE